MQLQSRVEIAVTLSSRDHEQGHRGTETQRRLARLRLGPPSMFGCGSASLGQCLSCRASARRDVLKAVKKLDSKNKHYGPSRRLVGVEWVESSGSSVNRFRGVRLQPEDPRFSWKSATELPPDGGSHEISQTS